MTDEEKREKAEEHARLIESIKMMLHLADHDFLIEAAGEFEKSASFYDSAAVLNRNWNPHAAKRKEAGAKQVRALADFIRYGKEVDALREKEETHESAVDEISKLFSR